KGRTLALHYRAIPEKDAEIRDAMERLAQNESGSLRLIAGKMVFELQPRHRNKGAVIAAFLAEPPFRGRRAVFIGDDTTDEDGFAVAIRAALEKAGGIWFGYSGSISERPSETPGLEIDGNVTAATLDLSRREYEEYYIGFANRVLWPLFHYRPSLIGYARRDL